MAADLFINPSAGETTLAAATRVRAPAAELPPVSVGGGAALAPFPLPVDHLDPSLGIEVMQFVGDGGQVTQSFPTQKQLDAYRIQPPVEIVSSAFSSPVSPPGGMAGGIA